MKIKAKVKQLLATLPTLLALHSLALGAEVDNYRLPKGFLTTARDATLVVNEHMNERIQLAIEKWKRNKPSGYVFSGSIDEKLDLARKVYGVLDWSILYGRVEWWMKQNDQINVFEPEETVYRRMGIWDGPVLKFYGCVGTVLLAGVPVGVDKVAHFLDGGYAYFKRVFVFDRDESRVFRFGAGTESGTFGWYSTGVFSNGDLVANYEGYLFFRSLNEPDVVPGKASIIGWREDGPYLQRPFDFADHVNSFWNEAMNPSHFRAGLGEAVLEELRGMCDRFREEPELFLPTNEAELRAKYSPLGLIEDLRYRMDRVCQR